MFKDLILQAVKSNGIALQYASPRLQDDLEVVLEAVAQSGHALEFASTTLRQERRVVLAAVHCSGRSAVAFASKELRSDVEVLRAARAGGGYDASR
eukprot:g18449.t1